MKVLSLQVSHKKSICQQRCSYLDESKINQDAVTRANTLDMRPAEKRLLCTGEAGGGDSRRSRVEHGLGFGLQGQFQDGFGLVKLGSAEYRTVVVIDVAGFDGGGLRGTG
ncbi:hypothetical protein M0R45_016016 [Rubus argutus]|uniref:Uncharacterized protein n=1 Tax=Rubus argutus TaxID=59490 RepID=A0AAW1XV00_RUBAR